MAWIPSPATHDTVADQAYGAGGGDYFRSGYYSHGLFSAAAVQNTSAISTTAYARPFLVPVRRTFDRIGVNVAVAATSGTIRLGVYADAGGVPGALIVDAGTATVDTTGPKEMAINLTLNPGTVWLALLAVTSGTISNVTSYSTSQIIPGVATSTTAPTSASNSSAFSWLPADSSALPATAIGATLTGAIAKAVCLRAA